LRTSWLIVGIKFSLHLMRVERVPDDDGRRNKPIRHPGLDPGPLSAERIASGTRSRLSPG
jgi:hypothetical protein